MKWSLNKHSYKQKFRKGECSFLAACITPEREVLRI